MAEATSSTAMTADYPSTFVTPGVSINSSTYKTLRTEGAFVVETLKNAMAEDGSYVMSPSTVTVTAGAFALQFLAPNCDAASGASIDTCHLVCVDVGLTFVPNTAPATQLNFSITYYNQSMRLMGGMTQVYTGRAGVEGGTLYQQIRSFPGQKRQNVASAANVFSQTDDDGWVYANPEFRTFGAVITTYTSAATANAAASAAAIATALTALSAVWLSLISTQSTFIMLIGVQSTASIHRNDVTVDALPITTGYGPTVMSIINGIVTGANPGGNFVSGNLQV